MTNKNIIKGKCCKCGEKATAIVNLQKYCTQCHNFYKWNMKSKNYQFLKENRRKNK